MFMKQVSNVFFIILALTLTDAHPLQKHNVIANGSAPEDHNYTISPSLEHKVEDTVKDMVIHKYEDEEIVSRDPTGTSDAKNTNLKSSLSDYSPSKETFFIHARTDEEEIIPFKKSADHDNNLPRGAEIIINKFEDEEIMPSMNSDNSDNSDNSENSENSENSVNSENSENSENKNTDMSSSVLESSPRGKEIVIRTRVDEEIVPREEFAPEGSVLAREVNKMFEDPISDNYVLMPFEDDLDTAATLVFRPYFRYSKNEEERRHVRRRRPIHRSSHRRSHDY